jgi:hypothetical protein
MTSNDMHSIFLEISNVQASVNNTLNDLTSLVNNKIKNFFNVLY